MTSESLARGESIMVGEIKAKTLNRSLSEILSSPKNAYPIYPQQDKRGV
jgi:hypothetical protein